MHLLITFEGIAACIRLAYYFENQSLLSMHIMGAKMFFFFCLGFTSILIICVENGRCALKAHFVRLENPFEFSCASKPYLASCVKQSFIISVPPKNFLEVLINCFKLPSLCH